METTIILAILGLATAIVGRSLYRTVSNKKDCSCGSNSSMCSNAWSVTNSEKKCFFALKVRCA